ENLAAFARLYGYVRYFHPSDESAAAKWDAFLFDNVNAVEGAKSPEELAASLEKAFSPVAPAMKVYVTGKEPPAAEPVKEGAKLLAWHHIGVGAGSQSLYSSQRIDNRKSLLELATKKELKIPDPNKPYVADLGGGVSCRVPLALPVVDGDTQPKAT